MKNNKKIAVRVGLMVLISTGLLLVSLVFISQWRLSREGFHLNIRFSFLNNLSEGAPVIVGGGITVGHVEKIYQEDLKTYARIYLKNSLAQKLPKNKETRFAIFTKGLIGQKYINLNIGEAKEDDPFYQDGDEAVGIDPPSIDQMLLSFSSWFDGKNGGQILAQIIHETKLFIDNLNSIVVSNKKDIRATIQTTRKSVTSLSNQLNTLVDRLNTISKNFVDISENNKKDIELLLANVSLISKDLNQITKRVSSGRGSIGKFLNDERLYEDVYGTIQSAREFFDTIKKSPWRLMYKGN